MRRDLQQVDSYENNLYQTNETVMFGNFELCKQSLQNSLAIVHCTNCTFCIYWNLNLIPIFALESM